MTKLSRLGVIPLLLIAASGAVPAADAPKAGAKQKVLGIGGLFFKAEDPKALAKWYEDNLGISLTPTSLGLEPWHQQAGPTVFQPFKKDSKYFGRPEQEWMVNFRVADLKAMVAQLRAAGIAVEDPQSDPGGDFTRLHDPEGNPIELWEPKTPK